MGVSTDAILIYGIDFGEDPESPLFEYNDETGEHLAYDLTKDGPLEYVRHCSGDYPMHIIGLKSAHYEAARGYPTTFDRLPENGAVITVEDYEALRLFCEKHNLPYSEPKWLLCSMWW